MVARRGWGGDRGSGGDGLVGCRGGLHGRKGGPKGRRLRWRVGCGRRRWRAGGRRRVGLCVDGFVCLLDTLFLYLSLCLALGTVPLLLLESRRDKLGGDGLVERLERSGGLFQQRLELCGVYHMCGPPKLGLDLVADGRRCVGVVWKHRRRCCAEQSPIQRQRLGPRVHSDTTDEQKN